VNEPFNKYDYLYALAMAALKTLIFTVIMPGTVTVYIPYWLLSSPSTPTPLSIGLWRGKGTPAPIDPPKELVMRGLYRYVRNPMYVGILTLLIGETLFFASRQLFIYAGVIFLFFNLFVIFYEEPALRQKFGESYRRYCETVPRWIPRWTKAGALLA
jgi:hypothetical protein